MSTRGKVWVFGILPALVAFWAVIIWGAGRVLRASVG